MTTFQQSSQYRPDGSQEWDHLLHWEQVDHGVVDINQIGPEEDAYDEDMFETGDRIEEDPQEFLDEEEEPEEAQGQSKLNSEQIVDIINERIKHFTETWKPNKGVPKEDEVDYDLEALWEEAEATGRRQQLVKTYETEVAYFTQRLDRLCEEIVKFPASNLERVRHQCGNLEVTINSIQLAGWLLSVYKLEPVESSEDEVEPTGNSDIEHESTRLEPISEAPTQRVLFEIIDLGSPPVSSQDEMIVNSSPPPEQQHAAPGSSPPRFHTPDSVLVQSTGPPVEFTFHSPSTARAAPLQPSTQLSDEPEHASIASARRWKWADLIDTQDRKRIVTKALQEMKCDDREIIRDRLRVVGKVDMIREIPACLQMLANGETKMPGVLPRDATKIIIFTRLFLCWWLCDNYFRVEPSRWHLEELQQCLDDGSPDPSTFCDYLKTVMDTTFSPEALQNPDRPSQAEVIEISDDDNPFPKAAFQRKKQSNRSRETPSSTIVID